MTLASDQQGDFKSGQRHGRWLLFDENGKPTKAATPRGAWSGVGPTSTRAGANEDVYLDTPRPR